MEFNQKLEEGVISLHMQIGKNIIKIFLSRGELMSMYVFVDTNQLSCAGEGNGNTLLCSCLENPRNGGAWWAAVSGVAQSWTRLKQLSSSRSSSTFTVL